MTAHDDRRIAACLKACEGLDTAFLESNKLADCGSTHAAIAQRDDLLALLERLAAHPLLGLDAMPARAAIARVKESTPRYTSISKGGSYTKLGTIHGAGKLKGLVGIAYRDNAGQLYLREPECFNARMKLIAEPAEGGVA